ncbi:MAG TPA: hypothetical protein VH206_00130 [Xanthobacteraceae bacterium]|jgi:hypothetical protein|nr:hypothetical protein [Xanthobacteraceae bacterium]
MNITTKLSLAAMLALFIAVPAQAQQANQAKEGDYYASSKTMVQQPTSQELSQERHGDYYQPGKTMEQQPTAQQLSEDKKGDYYAPTK